MGAIPELGCGRGGGQIPSLSMSGRGGGRVGRDRTGPMPDLRWGGGFLHPNQSFLAGPSWGQDFFSTWSFHCQSQCIMT